MNLQLEDKTALVSGSSQGIGFAIAEALAKEGAAVVINSNKQDLVDKAIDKISKTAPGAHLIAAVADLSTQQGVQDLVRKVPAVDIWSIASVSTWPRISSRYRMRTGTR